MKTHPYTQKHLGIHLRSSQEKALQISRTWLLAGHRRLFLQHRIHRSQWLVLFSTCLLPPALSIHRSGRTPYVSSWLEPSNRCASPKIDHCEDVPWHDVEDEVTWLTLQHSTSKIQSHKLECSSVNVVHAPHRETEYIVGAKRVGIPIGRFLNSAGICGGDTFLSRVETVHAHRCSSSPFGRHSLSIATCFNHLDKVNERLITCVYCAYFHWNLIQLFSCRVNHKLVNGYTLRTDKLSPNDLPYTCLLTSRGSTGALLPAFKDTVQTRDTLVSGPICILRISIASPTHKNFLTTTPRLMGMRILGNRWVGRDGNTHSKRQIK